MENIAHKNFKKALEELDKLCGGGLQFKSAWVQYDRNFALVIYSNEETETKLRMNLPKCNIDHVIHTYRDGKPDGEVLEWAGPQSLNQIGTLFPSLQRTIDSIDKTSFMTFNEAEWDFEPDFTLHGISHPLLSIKMKKYTADLYRQISQMRQMRNFLKKDHLKVYEDSEVGILAGPQLERVESETVAPVGPKTGPKYSLQSLSDIYNKKREEEKQAKEAEYRDCLKEKKRIVDEKLMPLLENLAQKKKWARLHIKHGGKYGLTHRVTVGDDFLLDYKYSIDIEKDLINYIHESVLPFSDFKNREWFWANDEE